MHPQEGRPSGRPIHVHVLGAAGGRPAACGSRGEVAALDCHEEGPPGGTLTASTDHEHQGGPPTCCTPDWISAESASTSVFGDDGEHLDQLAVAPDVDSLNASPAGSRKSTASPSAR